MSDTLAAPLPAAWMMGQAPVVREHVRGVLFSFTTYLLYGVVLAVQVYFGLVTPAAAIWLTLASTATNLGFYALVRSGWSETTRDPGLSRTQLVVGVGFMYASYAVQGPSSPALLIVMASHIVYSMFSMSPKAVWRLVTGSLAGLALTMVACQALWPDRYRVDVQVTAFLYASLVVPLIALLASHISSLHLRLRTQSEQLKSALAEVQQLASRDELTRVHNRHHMTGLLGEQRRLHLAASAPLALALIDIDHFKRINDNHGHAMGDEVLRRFAALAKAELRASDLVARWGGEEFLIALPHTHRGDALEVLERLQRTLGGADGQQHMPPGLAVSFSAGVVEMQDDEALDAAIERADQAMYAAKRSGRARCVPA